MPSRRPVYLLAALGAMTPSVASADPAPTIGDAAGLAPHWGTPSGSVAMIVAAVVLFGVAVLLASGRINWRMGAIAVVACGALFGGDAIVDGAQTAIAVSQ